MPKQVKFGGKPQPKAQPADMDAWVSGGGEPAEPPAPEDAPEAIPMKRLTIDVPDPLHRRIKTSCAERGVKMADEIRALLEERFPTG